MTSMNLGFSRTLYQLLARLDLRSSIQFLLATRRQIGNLLEAEDLLASFRRQPLPSD